MFFVSMEWFVVYDFVKDLRTQELRNAKIREFA